MCINKVKLFLLAVVIYLINAQSQIEVQFLGDTLSEEEATDRELCHTKHCLLDSAYLFYSATQNKSVRPCDDFKEFTLGTFIRYRSVNDRKFSGGFGNDVADVYDEKMRKAMAARANEKDTRVSRGLKDFYAKCVNSKFINKNAVNEYRTYLRSIGLNFFPEPNHRDFNFVKFIEEFPFLGLQPLFHAKLVRKDSEGALRLSYFEEGFMELKLTSYQDLLSEMMQVFRNGSFADEFRKEFAEIAKKQIEFYKLQQNVEASIEEDETKLLTIAELNELTSILNIDWLKVVNNQLITKVGLDEVIAVENVRLIAKLAEFLSAIDKDVLADYLVYDLLHNQSGAFVLYQNDKWKALNFGNKKARERWHQCYGIFYFKMSPALDFLYLQKYGGEDFEKPLEQFSRKTIEFALKKITAEIKWDEKVLQDVTNRLQSIKFIIGNINSNIDADTIEQIYSEVHFDSNQNYAQVANDILKNFREVLLETKESKPRYLFDFRLVQDYDRFKYFPNENIMYLPLVFLQYPFYHHERPQFFNTATVSVFMYRSLHSSLGDYLKKEHNITDFNVFEDAIESAYEFYDDWLKEGGKELNLGANRLTDRQLFWFASARVGFILHDRLLDSIYDDELHKAFRARPGFNEAYNCPKMPEAEHDTK